MPETRSMKKIIKDKILEQDKNNKKQYSLNKWRSQLNNNYDEWVDDFGMHQPVVYPITKYCDPLENLQNTDVEKEESQQNTDVEKEESQQNTDVEKEESQQNTSLSDRFSNYETPLPDKENLVRDDIVSDVVKSNDSNTAEESDEEYELEENESQESDSNESQDSFTNEENDSQESESNESEDSFTNEDIVNNTNEWKYRKPYNYEDEDKYFQNMPVTDYLIPIGIGLFAMIVTYLNYKSSKYKYEDDY
jgi:hypothetical protein